MQDNGKWTFEENQDSNGGGHRGELLHRKRKSIDNGRGWRESKSQDSKQAAAGGQRLGQEQVAKLEGQLQRKGLRSVNS